ncbi:MAG TPA: DNA gyrase inhibitor YacG [Phycisphaeraceae bacterium]
MTKPKRQPSSSRPCPICQTPVSQDGEYFPFCSQRCRQIDLGRWLTGKYVISRPIGPNDLEEGRPDSAS